MTKTLDRVDWQTYQQAEADAAKAEGSAKLKALFAGWCLIQLKESAPHGTFMKLCSEHCKVSQTTYNRWMNAAQHYMLAGGDWSNGVPETVARDDLTLQDAAGFYAVRKEQQRRADEQRRIDEERKREQDAAREAAELADKMRESTRATDFAKAQAAAAAERLRKQVEAREKEEQRQRREAQIKKGVEEAEKRTAEARARQQAEQRRREEEAERTRRAHEAFKQFMGTKSQNPFHRAVDLMLQSPEGRTHLKRFMNSMFHPDSAKFQADAELLGAMNNHLTKLGS